MDGHWKFRGGGGGISKAIFLKEKYEANTGFPGGGVGEF